MPDGLLVLREGEKVWFRPGGHAVVTLVMDADEAAWFARHLPAADAMAGNFAIIADRLRRATEGETDGNA